jgi:acyl carrier protein
MTETEMVVKINELLASGFELSLDKLTPQALLKEDLALDSLDAVDMLVYLEENFSIKVAGERLTTIKTMQDVYDLVKEVLLKTDDKANLGHGV